MNQLDIERAIYELRELNLPENLIARVEVILNSLLVFNSPLLPEIEFDIDESYDEIAIRFDNGYNTLSIVILNKRTVIVCLVNESADILYSKGYELNQDPIDDILKLFRDYMMDNEGVL